MLLPLYRHFNLQSLKICIKNFFFQTYYLKQMSSFLFNFYTFSSCQFQNYIFFKILLSNRLFTKILMSRIKEIFL